MLFLSPGEKIKQLREYLGIKQIELEEIGVSRCYISMLESNKRNINKKILKKIIAFFQERAENSNINLIIDESKLLLSKKDEAEIYCEKILDGNPSLTALEELSLIGEEYALYTTLTKVEIKLGNLLYNKGLYSKSFIKYYNALELCNFHCDEKIKTKVYSLLGKSKLQCLNYEEALSYLFKAYHTLDEYDDCEEYQCCIFNIAIAYKKIREFDNALIYINKLHSLCDPSIDFNKYVDIIILEANCYIEQEQYETAIRIYTQLIEAYEDTLAASLGFIYNNLGLIYLKLNNIPIATEYFDNAINIRSKLDKTNLSHSMIDKSQIYIELKDYDKAINLLLDGLTLCQSFGETEYILIAYKRLEHIYKIQNDVYNLENTYINIIKILEDISSPNVAEFYTKLSILYLDSERYSQCKILLSNILTIINRV